MANTASVYVRIDPTLKSDVEKILQQLNVTPSALIQMLYGQIKLTKSIPFEIKLPSAPVFIEDLTEEQLDEEISKGIEDIKNGDVYSSDEVKSILKNEFKL